ncbi:MAG: CrcB family protein [Phycisphaerales bacterium]|nr:CrcB family protein [Phycisphaerales bacterium]
MTFIAGMLMVMLGGGIGALARFGFQRAGERWTNLPGWTAIFVVNILGSFLIAVSFGWLHGEGVLDAKDHLSTVNHFKDELSIQMGMGLFVTGVCGGFTTFSTFSLDNLFLAYENRAQLFFNIIGSLVLATLAAWAGLLVGGAMA